MARRLGYLNPKNTLFMLCDVQEKFRSAYANFEPLLKNSIKLLEAGKILQIPLIVSEQYPEKFGKSVAELDSMLKHANVVYGKQQFSMLTPEVTAKITELNDSNQLQSVVLFGIATHVCIEQTSVDLRLMNLDVHVVADCSLAQSEEDRRLAIRRMRQIGCIITSSESVIFKFMKTENHKDFDDLQKLMRLSSADTGLAN